MDALKRRVIKALELLGFEVLRERRHVKQKLQCFRSKRLILLTCMSKMATMRVTNGSPASAAGGILPEK